MLHRYVPISRLMLFSIILFAFAISSQTSFAQNDFENLLKNSINKGVQQLQQQSVGTQPPPNQQQTQTNQNNQTNATYEDHDASKAAINAAQTHKPNL